MSYPIITYVLSLSSLGFVALAILSAIQARRFTRLATHAVGNVVEFEVVAIDNSTYLRPVIRFADCQGTVHTIRSAAAEVAPAFTIGDTVSIFYPVDQPDLADLQGVPRSTATRVFCALATVSALLAVFIWMLDTWQNR